MMGRPVAAMRPGIPTPSQKTENFRVTLRRLVRRLGPEQLPLMVALFVGVVSVGFTVAGPRILGNATNVLFNGLVGRQLPAGVTKTQAIAALRAHGENQFAQMVSGMNLVPGRGVDINELGRILGIAAIMYLSGALFSFVQNYLMAGITQRTMFGLRSEVEAKLTKLPLRYFDANSHGDILSRVTNDIDNLTTTLQQGLSQLLSSVLTIIGVMGMMFWISPLLGVVSIVIIPLAIGSTLLIARRSQAQFVNQWAKTGELNGLVEETHTGHLLVEVFGRRESTIEEFERQNEHLFDASFRAQFLSGIIQPTIQFLGNINYVVIAVLGGYKVATGALSLGDVQAFIQYSRQFTMPINQIAGQMNMLQSGLASAERVFEFLDATEELPDRASTVQLPVAGSVLIDNISFRYEPDKPLIEDFTLSVSPGQIVAIVGPTGAGKTTIVNLLVRFYEVDSGEIFLDNKSYRGLTRDEVRRNFGMVLQDTWLFAGTIEENIAYGRDGATHEEIVDAAKSAYVDRFVQTLPDGYKTFLNEDASNISSGQKQLLTIARAFLA
ncbi:MAG TPA: ABC transporter ATP-binding protein, partial [Acidimicrobiales bacterium]|nr:ABC transporter ATP-binding protein [Acidimicrobiales bacterium]